MDLKTRDPKPICWLGSTIRDIKDIPIAVKRSFGYALYRIQHGEYPTISKRFDGQIQELREDDDQNRTYRAVYVASFKEAVYVLHVFNKKSSSGIATSRRDAEIIQARYAEAKALHAEVEKGNDR